MLREVTIKCYKFVLSFQNETKLLIHVSEYLLGYLIALFKLLFIVIESHLVKQPFTGLSFNNPTNTKFTVLLLVLILELLKL